jgi:protein O-GlcNAc transferase
MALFDKISSLLGRAKTAAPAAEPSVDLSSDAQALICKGNDLEDAGQLKEALALYEQAASLVPGFSSAHLNRGNALLALGQPDQAIKAYQDAIAVQPDFAAAHFNLGNAQFDCGQTAAALQSYLLATRYKPAFASAWVALGNVQGDLSRNDDAVISYQKAIALDSGNAKVHRNLGLTLRQLGRLSDAQSSFATAVSVDPADLAPLCDLSNVYRELGEVNAAVRTARQACALDPKASSPHSLLLFCLSHSGDISPRELYLEHCRFGEKFEPDRSDAVPAHLNTRDPDRVLQVGLVSADLRNHAVASFFEPVFYLLLQMRGIHLHVYDNGRPADEVSRRMKAQSPNWIEVATMSVDALSQQIRRDRIDVLIDLSGHTPGHRLMNFAQKPAPVQMSWIGYPGTTGMRLMDYYIADPHFLPPGEFDAYFTEKILRLPANAPFQSIDHPPDVNPLPALTKGFICFGSFNRLDKISQEVVQLWAKLLCALPDARMVVGGMPLKGSLDQITDWFVQSGVEPQRLTFYRRSNMHDYLQLHHQVDVCLDTFPYGGGTTTCHALYMGVPTLTIAGQTPAAVSSRSILSHAGIKTQFVAANPDEFLAKAQWCASHLDQLAALRSDLRERFKASNMMQPAVVAGGLEAALRHAWRRWCQELPAESFEVTHDNGHFAVTPQ